MHSTASAKESSSPPVIVLENLVKFFGRFAAIRGISASFAAGRLYVVLGDNGAGKSTLLRIVAGLMEPSQGKVTLLGATRIREVAQRVGYMGHAPLLYDELSAMENLRYFAGLYGLHDERICEDAMLMVGLDPELSRRAGQYSRLIAGFRENHMCSCSCCNGSRLRPQPWRAGSIPVRGGTQLCSACAETQLLRSHAAQFSR